jgi:pentose-5-phosphate-3-epimerase
VRISNYCETTRSGERWNIGIQIRNHPFRDEFVNEIRTGMINTAISSGLRVPVSENGSILNMVERITMTVERGFGGSFVEFCGV